jgi:hypothetical protein
MKLINNSGATINSFTVSYTGEQWRNSAAAPQTLSLQYSLSASNIKTGTYVTVSELNFVSPISGGTSRSQSGGGNEMDAEHLHPAF